MFEVCPKNQDAAITDAVVRVFPEVNHHYCMWHIEKKVPIYLSYIDHEHIEEFESDLMIEKYGLQDNKWLEKIYSI